MSTMTDSQAWMSQFVDAEAALLRSLLASGALDPAPVRAFEAQFYGSELRWESPVDLTLSNDLLAAALPEVVVRRLLRADRFEVEGQGPVVAWVVSQGRQPPEGKTSLWRRLVVGSAALRILSVDRVCVDCHAKGTLPNARKCPACHGSGWKHLDLGGFGPRYALGACLETLRVEAPTHPRYLAAWEA
jgi:hypothetical protein